MSLSSWLYPPQCLLCSRLGTLLCHRCAASLTAWENDLNWPLQTYPTLKRVYSAIEYRDRGIDVMLSVKYDGYWRYTRLWAELLFFSVGKLLSQARINVLVPVPQHPNHFLKRGFHPTRQLATHLSQLTGIPCAPRLLQRVGSDRAQAERTAMERMATHYDFRVRPGEELPTGAKVCLLDDVCTTGTTLSGCARALASLGVTTCIGATVARTP